MVGHVGVTDRAEQDRVGGPQLLEPVGGHHRAGLALVLAAPRVLVVGQREAEALRGVVEHGGGGGRDLGADPVAGDQRDAVGARHARDQRCARARISATTSSLAWE